MQTKKRKAARRHRAASDTGAYSPATVLKSALFAFLPAVLIGLLLLLLSTGILLATKDPNRYHAAVGAVLAAVVALLAGWIAARLNRRRLPLLCGLAEGALLLLVLLLLSALLPIKVHIFSGALNVGLHALLPLLAVAGSMLGARKRTGSRPYQRRR